METERDIYQSICLSIYLPSYLAIYLSIYLSMNKHMYFSNGFLAAGRCIMYEMMREPSAICRVYRTSHLGVGVWRSI